MVSIIKNITLMLVLSAVIIMMLGIVFYDYIPNRAEVKESNEYETEESTTKLLATIKDEEQNLFGSTKVDSDGNIDTVIHAYSLDAGDLRVYAQANSYESGKADPFADISADASGNSGSNTSTGNTGNGVAGTTNNNSNNNTSNNNTSNTTTNKGDGTLFNSTTSK